MPDQVVAVASGKGGVGKTTTVVNLGVVLRRADHSVALVDADLGMANLGPKLGITDGGTLHDVLAGEATLEDALVEEAPGFAVLRGSESLMEYADADPGNLSEVLETLAEDYEFVLVDTGAGMSHEDVLPLGLADRVLLVTSPDPAAIDDTRKTAELVGLASGDIAGLVVTKAEADTDAAAVAEEVGVELLGEIPHDGMVPESAAAGRPLEAIDPDGPAAGAYRELAAALADGSVESPRATLSADEPASSEDSSETADEAPTSSEATTASEGDAPEAPEEPAASAEEASAATDAAPESTEPPEADDDSAEADEAARADQPDGDTAEAEDEDDPNAEEPDRSTGLLSRLRRLFR